MILLALLFSALFFSASAKYSDSCDPGKHFKLTALYFADSILKGLTIDDETVEGAVFVEVFEQLSEVFADQKDKNVNSVSESFKRGLDYSKAIANAENMRRLNKSKWSQEISELKKIYLN